MQHWIIEILQLLHSMLKKEQKMHNLLLFHCEIICSNFLTNLLEFIKIMIKRECCNMILLENKREMEMMMENILEIKIKGKVQIVSIEFIYL